MNPRNNLSRITIDIPAVDHKKLKAVAALLGKSMREIVIESIEERLNKYPNKKTLKAIQDVDNGVGLEEVEDVREWVKKLGI
jgi:hypothetical protein